MADRIVPKMNQWKTTLRAVLLLLFFVNVVPTTSPMEQLHQLQTQAFELLNSTLPMPLKRGLYQRFIHHADHLGYQRFMAHAKHTRNETLDHLPINIEIPFMVDNQMYSVTLDDNHMKDPHGIASTVQTSFPNVLGLERQMYTGVVHALRERAVNCASACLDVDAKACLDAQEYADYCHRLYTKISLRMHVEQPNVIGMCPALATKQDYAVVEGIVFQPEALRIIEWARTQKQQQLDLRRQGEQPNLDSVDGLPSCTYDLDLNKTVPPFQTLAETMQVTLAQLKTRIKERVLPSLAALPIAFKDPRLTNDDWIDQLFQSKNTSDVYIFVREYSMDKGGRSELHWHRDAASYSINLSLNSNEEYDGGHLSLYLGGDQEVVVPKARSKVGHAVAFGPNVVHSVSQVTKGTRWSLVLFFGKRVDEEFPDCFVDFTLKNYMR
jgi:predicted 2-oxoglutarate/Fe(II)-dependent dioxygenase YbiX